jgi:polyhydroxyalkanoate synthesis regulator phasin
MNRNNPTDPGQSKHTNTHKETEAVNSYDKPTQEVEANGSSYATESAAGEKYARITEPSEVTALGGVDKCGLEKKDKAVQPGEWDNSVRTPSVPMGKNLKTACESAELIARANRPGCSDREKEALFARFVELNGGKVRAAFVSELRKNLAKRGFRDVKKHMKDFRYREENRTTSIVDGQVQSLLRIWFFDPSLTKHYDPTMGILLSTYRRFDIYAAVREIVRECVSTTEISGDDKAVESEDEREVAIFRGSRDVARDDSEGVFAFDDSEFPSALDALAASAEETVRGIAAGDYEQSESFRQLLDVLEDLVKAGKLSVDNRRAFLVSMVHDATVCAEIVHQKPGTIRQVARRTRAKLHSACEARGDELLELKELLVALKARCN